METPLIDRRLVPSLLYIRSVKDLENVMHTVRNGILADYIGKDMHILCETEKNGYYHGYTENYIEARVKNCGYKPNDIVKVTLKEIENNGEYITCLASEE